eukprot:CAMPEP_0181310288 /NCGR_PEP_ID=MMETSP1101-20121128/12503_1 /TAXON_ID=46948 /ORGANISM="Rhodomonas abbreviata, Strain Caron Lab Isolate" /LENGTH=100 /DNA_ID=CAMNT_0023416901 /DNA_START=25 /DNA_END=327 /DNA_ORIENTATION=-
MFALGSRPLLIDPVVKRPNLQYPEAVETFHPVETFNPFELTGVEGAYCCPRVAADNINRVFRSADGDSTLSSNQIAVDVMPENNITHTGSEGNSSLPGRT